MTSPDLDECLARLNGRINWERKLRRGAMRVDLAPMADLMERLGHPERAWRAVHVAGSKGKGSVARLLAEALRAAGYSVGVYASPHVETIHERIRIDGDWIADQALVRALQRVLAARDRAESEGTAAHDATWFDLVTAAGFLCFQAADVDWAVVEVGLGGRLDSTNVVRAALSVITTIELEHTDILGDTRAAIAREKAGILKPGAVLACGVPPDPSLPRHDDPGREIAWIAANQGVYWECSVPSSDFDRHNQALARLGLKLLQGRGMRGVHPDLLSAAVIQNARLPGRMERFSHRGASGEIPVVLDGAHVASSVAAVLGQLRGQEFAKGNPQVVLSLGQDKDASAILKTLVGHADRVYCTSVEGSLHRDPTELAALAAAQGLECQAHPDPKAALREALAAAGSSGWVLVIGSLHLAGALRSQLLP